MRCHLSLMIRLWFLFISQASATTSEMCSSIIEQSSPGSKNLSLLVQDMTAIIQSCFCEFSTDPVISISSLCLFYQCFPCQSCPSSCFCTDYQLDISHARSCLVSGTCPPGINQKYSCQTLTDRTPDQSREPPTGCSNEQTTEGLILVLQPKVTGHNDGDAGPAFWKVMCYTRSVAPNTSSIATWNSRSTTTPATTDTQINVIIGVVVGVGGAILIITAIVIVLVVLRRRRAECNNLHAKNTSQSNASVSSETAYATNASYTIPVSAAYDNATSGTTSNYESIADDNEEFGESNDAYTEVKEISDHNDYDNREMGRSDAYSLCKETGKDYEIVSENQSANIENETTVIDNEFYG